MMKRNSLILVMGLALGLGACGGGGGSGGGGQQTLTCTAMADAINPLSKIIHPMATNQVPISVGCGYINEPCVSVTVCVPGTSTCQTIDNVLLDTGSFGLRLFTCAMSLSLPSQTTSSGTPVAECVGYGDGSHDWGPVKVADVQLGGLKASSVPIQVIDPNFGTVPTSCNSQLDYSPQANGFNGIIGVGLGIQDCGSSCVSTTNNGQYYACSGTGCTATALPLAKQVTNAVTMFSSYNKGVMLDIPDPGGSGSSNLTGTLNLGVGDDSTNTPVSGTKTFAASYDSSTGNYSYTTIYSSTTYSTSFVDSGSNGLFFPSGFPACSDSSAAPGFQCPSSTQSLSATTEGYTGTPSSTISFSIANASDLVNTGNSAFDNLGADISGAFDWGLPFFMGRKVYVIPDGLTTGTDSGAYTPVTGPAWVY